MNTSGRTVGWRAYGSFAWRIVTHAEQDTWMFGVRTWIVDDSDRGLRRTMEKILEWVDVYTQSGANK